MDFEEYREAVTSSDRGEKLDAVEQLIQAVKNDPGVAGDAAKVLDVALSEGLDRLVRQQDAGSVERLPGEIVREDEVVWKALQGLVLASDIDDEAVKRVVDSSTVGFFIDACFYGRVERVS